MPTVEKTGQEAENKSMPQMHWWHEYPKSVCLLRIHC